MPKTSLPKSAADKHGKSGGAKAKRSKKKKNSPGPQSAGQSSGQPSAPVASASSRSARSAGARSAGSRSQARVASSDRDVGSSGGSSSSSSSGGSANLYFMGVLHVVDAGLGAGCLAYGGMVPVVEVTAACVAYGLVLVIGFLAGLTGYYSKCCNSAGLMTSAGAGLLTALLDFAAFVATLVSWESFVAFLSDNSADLMLDESSVSTISGLQVLFATIFAVLGCLEAYRFCAMRNIRNQMMSQDGSSHSSSRSRTSRQKSGNWFKSMFGLTKRKRTEDFVMFDDNASMESALLWSKNGGQPASEDYLEFVPDHERGLENFTSTVSLPRPPADRTDY